MVAGEAPDEVGRKMAIVILSAFQWQQENLTLLVWLIAVLDIFLLQLLQLALETSKWKLDNTSTQEKRIGDI